MAERVGNAPFEYFSDRRPDRDRYEVALVQVLQTQNIPITLSTDSEDILFGIDAWDTEFDIPWDIYVGNLNTRNVEKKIAKTESARVGLLSFEKKLVDSYWNSDNPDVVLSKITNRYEMLRELNKSKSFITHQEIFEELPERRKMYRKGIKLPHNQYLKG